MVSDTFSSWAMEKVAKVSNGMAPEFDHDTWKILVNCFKTSQDAERAREVVKSGYSTIFRIE